MLSRTRCFEGFEVGDRGHLYRPRDGMARATTLSTGPKIPGRHRELSGPPSSTPKAQLPGAKVDPTDRFYQACSLHGFLDLET